MEVEEPGATNTDSYAKLPTGLSFNATTRQLIASPMPTKGGALELALMPIQASSTAQPVVFRITVAPVFTGSTAALSWTRGTPISAVDVYAAFDTGRMSKTLAVSGLPSGLSFDGKTIPAGTPTSVGSGTITLTCTNSAGQTTSQSISYTVSSGSGAAPVSTTAPAITTAQNGSPIVFTAAAFSGSPAPTVTYDVLSGGTAIATNVTSGSYVVTASAGTAINVRANASNASGSTTSTSANFTVTAASSTTAAPNNGTMAGVTPLATFDPAQGITLSGSNVSSWASSQGGAYSLTQSTSGIQPTVVTRNGKKAVYMTGGQFLQMANAMGLASTDPLSYIAIFEPASSTATQGIIDISTPSLSLAVDRHSLIASTSSGFSHRKCDASSMQGIAAQGAATYFVANTVRCLIGRSPGGTGNAEFNMDGQGSAIVATTASGSLNVTTTTIGGTMENGTFSKPVDGYYYHLDFYNLFLSDAQAEDSAVWANSNFPTANNA